MDQSHINIIRRWGADASEALSQLLVGNPHAARVLLAGLIAFVDDVVAANEGTGSGETLQPGELKSDGSYWTILDWRMRTGEILKGPDGQPIPDDFIWGPANVENPEGEWFWRPPLE